MFWNVNNLKNKLESDSLLSWLNDFDVIFLSEVKRRVVEVPGFEVFEANNEKYSRGGLVMLMKPYLASDLRYVDKSVNEQLWFELKSVPDVIFGGVYIPPSDSIYYKDEAFAQVQSKTINPDKQYVFGGDVNARCGKLVSDLCNGRSQESSYSIVDAIINSNGRDLVQVCKDNNLYVINGLSARGISYPGKLTFRRRKKWISELDRCVVSENALDNVVAFDIDDNLDLPSDHAPVSLIFSCSKQPSCDELYESACDLGGHAALLGVRNVDACKKPIPCRSMNPEIFSNCISTYEQSVVESFQSGSPDIVAKSICNAMYQSCIASRKPQQPNQQNANDDPRWKRIMAMDEKSLWDAVNWNGEIDTAHTSNDNKPSEAQFQKHLESLLNPKQGDIHTQQQDTNHYDTTIPILDNPIERREVENMIPKMKPKGCGPDGVDPGCFGWLPNTWVFILTMLCNLVFTYGYPLCWCVAKLTMLFKKGIVGECDNYRGISIINSCSKLYDYVINNRLVSWFKPSREQAGGQSKRGCIELIVCLRLLISFCKRKRYKLFLVFVDFSKAYDRVSRGKMFSVLKLFGCGTVMLSAIIAMYTITSCVLGSTVINSCIGVRQGSPTSCFLFVIFVEMLIRMIKNNVNPDSFLDWLHTLMLMDDTVILATSRERLEQKLKYLEEYCKEYGMVINEKKTKLMVINGEEEDRETIFMGDVAIKHADSYVYLGAIITADGSTATSIVHHAKEKEKSLNKLLIFLAVNYDAPFYVKLKVFKAAFSASILYSMESWIGMSTKPIEKLYVKGVKALLGVRHSTLNNMCLIESGIPPLKSFIYNAQGKFFSRMMNRMDLEDDPLGFALRLVEREDPQMWRNIQRVLATEDHNKTETDHIKQTASQDTRSRVITYCKLNPGHAVHALYNQTQSYIPDSLRISLTRLRLSSHRLRIELGRWSKTPRPGRLCSCGLLQDEEHILTKRF